MDGDSREDVKMPRKSPIRHKVKSHKRGDKLVRSFQRGSGIKPKRKRKVVHISSAASKDISSSQVPSEVRITKRKQIGKREKEITLVAESVAYPIIYEECEKLGIPPPRIEWVANITVSGVAHRGAYHHRAGERVIYQNIHIITLVLGLDYEVPEERIVRAIVRSCFHELKHYIDDEYHKVSDQEIREDYWKYEDGADEYARELIKRVKGEG